MTSGVASPANYATPPRQQAWTLPGAAPAYATPRTPGRPTEGAQVGVVAANLGTPLLPWQQYVADVAGERLPGGEYAYQIVVVSVPRQSGKTTLLRSVGVTRCLVNRRDVFYTAQTGKDGRERWKDLVKQLRVAPAFKSRIDVRVAAGSEAVTFWTGAAFRCFAPTPQSLHGYTPPTVMLDEAFAHTGPEGDLLMGAIKPAQMTIRDRQLWIVSTKGTAESEFLNRWLAHGRAGAARVAAFVWEAGEDVDADEISEADVAGYHPAVGFVINGKRLQAGEIIDARAGMSSAEWERAYLNRRTETESNLIPRAAFARMGAPSTDPPASTRDVVLTFDVAHDRSAASIVATWDVAGAPHGMVVMSAPGTAWVVPALAELRADWRPRAIAADDGGPAREVIEQARLAGVPVEALSMREFSTATGGWLSRVDEDDLSHDGSEHLADSVAGLAVRPTADGLVISRRHSTGDTSAAVAFVVGVYVLDRAKPAQQLVMRFAGEAAS